MSSGRVGKASGEFASIFQSAILRTKFGGRPNPSLFYFPGLASKPIWDAAQHPELKSIAERLQANKKTILDEYKHVRSKATSDYQIDEHKLHSGKWEWNSYVLKGKRMTEFAINAPRTAEILEESRLMVSTPFSFAFFSTLSKDSIIDPHFGPCNLRIRCHFPLIVPSVPEQAGMRIGGELIHWKEGVPVFFDDCYEHAVYNKSDQDRVVLLFDMWHPDLRPDEIDAIVDMFEYAEQQGWINNSKKSST